MAKKKSTAVADFPDQISVVRDGTYRDDGLLVLNENSAPEPNEVVAVYRLEKLVVAKFTFEPF